MTHLSTSINNFNCTIYLIKRENKYEFKIARANVLEKSFSSGKNANRTVADHFKNHHALEDSFRSFGGIQMANSSRAGCRQVQRKLKTNPDQNEQDDEHPVPVEYRSLAEHQFYWPVKQKNDQNEEIEIFDNLFFVCGKDIPALCEASTVFIDGTFKIAKRTGYEQLLMISQRQFNVERSKSMGYPLAFIFMKHQTKEDYTKVWNQLEVICQKKLNFDKIITDLEIPLQSSLSEKFPSATMVSCGVHTGRGWDRKKGKLGLIPFMKNTRHSFYDHDKLIKAFIYVDVTNPKINECCLDILDEYEEKCPENIKTAVCEYHQYLRDYYITLSEKTRFHPSRWSAVHVPSSSSAHFADFESSTNLAEGLNSALNKLIPKNESFDLVKSVGAIRQFKRQKLQDVLYLRTFDRLPATKKLVNVRQILRKK